MMHSDFQQLQNLKYFFAFQRCSYHYSQFPLICLLLCLLYPTISRCNDNMANGHKVSAVKYKLTW